MHEMKERLIKAGTDILNASKTELYVSMRFLDIALNSLGYEMDLSMKTIGTDSETIRFNPRYLIENYQNDSVLVNRAYLHMILHCVFRHMFHNQDKDEDMWNLSCDIAVTAVIDEMNYRSVRLVVPDERQAMYERLRSEMKVLTAEGIYQSFQKRPLTWFEMESAKKYFVVDDHVFWHSAKEEQGDSQNGDNRDNQDNHQDNNQSDQNNQNKEPEKDKSQKNQQQKEREQKWQEISEKMQTNMETISKDAAEMAGDLYDYIKIATRQRYDYRKFLRKFTTLREEIRLDMDSYDYIYYTYGLNHYGNMPLIEALEYKEMKKVEELAIVIDTSESCSGDYVRRFLEETFSILAGENFFKKMNVHIIQADAKAQVDNVITCEDDMKRYMENFKLIGFGGTDFRPAFEYVNELCKKKVFRKLKGMLYFTDGYGSYPAKRPDYDVAFVFLEENYNDRDVPPWAIKLILGPEDLHF